MKRYNVHYETASGWTMQYCLAPMSLKGAQAQLRNFQERYLNPDGTPKQFPNGKGFYYYQNARVAEHLAVPGDADLVKQLNKDFPPSLCRKLNKLHSK